MNLHSENALPHTTESGMEDMSPPEFVCPDSESKGTDGR